MPQPFVVPIFWGHDYVSNSDTTNKLQQMISDLVTGPFMNGLAQYGVQRGSIHSPIVIDDVSPPATIIYYDSKAKLKDEITKQLIKWITAGTVPSPASATDINQLYLILPPPGTTPQTYNFKNPKDMIGNGEQGWHNQGVTDPPGPPTYYWAIVKTNDVGPPSSTSAFVNGVAPKVSHELVEQFVDRNGSFEEIGDPCNNSAVNYRGWTVQQYHSDWDTSPTNPCGCINGDSPINLKGFLGAIGFDFQHRGLSSLGTSTISIGYIARTMQSRDGVQVPTPDCPM
jgi:hypothetical protein